MSFTASISGLFKLANLRRAAEGGDPSAIKVAADLMTSMGNQPSPFAPTSTDPGTGPQVDNRTAAGNPYASQMPAGPYGRAMDTAKTDPFKDITSNPLKQPKAASTFQSPVPKL